MREDKEVAVVVENTKNPRVKLFSVRYRLSEDKEVYANMAEICEPFDDEFGTKFGESNLLVKNLFNIRGVQSVTIDQYDIWIVIGKAFDWEEFEKLIITHIKQFIQVKRAMENKK